MEVDAVGQVKLEVTRELDVHVPSHTDDRPLPGTTSTYVFSMYTDTRQQQTMHDRTK